MKTFSKGMCFSLLIVFFACPVAVFAEDAMEFWAPEQGTQLFLFYYNKVSADTLYARGSKINEDFNLDGGIGVFRGAFFYGVGPYTTSTDVIVRFGSTSVDTGPGIHMSSPSGLGDITLHQAIWLVNDPENTFFILPDLCVTAPTAEYDNDKALNLGANRWSFRPGVGMLKGLTSKGTFLQAKVSVELYTKNDEYGPARQEQDKNPLYQFQAFLTQFVDQKTFASLDYFYDYGGETEIDGVAQDDKTKTHALQFGVTRMITDTVGVMIKYKKDIEVENGPKTDTLGIRVNYVFPPSGRK